jgi:hypothetical protein
VARVWVEEDAEPHLRCRLMHTLNVAAAKNAVTFANTEEDVYATVRGWLQAFLRRERPSTTPRKETR